MDAAAKCKCQCRQPEDLGGGTHRHPFVIDVSQNLDPATVVIRPLPACRASGP
jgi:hypothetical protein